VTVSAGLCEIIPDEPEDGERQKLMVTVLSPPEQRVTLHNVSWETYERLLADLRDSSAPRLTYDRGTLEIMSPSSEHERYNRTAAQIVEELAVELDVHVESLGSTTFRRGDIDQGFEPDSCFYIQNAASVRGKKRIDLNTDPPPDLVIEVDITSPSLDKFPLFAKVGVPEVWRFDGGQLVIYELAGGEYLERDASVAFPAVTAADVTAFIKESEMMTRPEWVRKLRGWARALK
jgi:Uma2 family endonuclease